MRLYKVIDTQDVCFPVSKKPIFFESDGLGVLQVPDRFAVVREDTQEALSVVSDSYTIVPNKEVISKAREAFERLSLPTVEDFRTTKNGARLYAEFVIPSIEIEVKKGDVVQMKGIFHNSYDTSKSYTLAVGGYRLVCSNGMMIGEELFRVRRKHIGEINVAELVHEVERAVGTYQEEVLPYWQNLAQLEIPMVRLEERLETAVEERILPKKFAARALESVTQSDSRDHADSASLWEVYNAFTALTTHEVAPRSYERSRQLGEISLGFVRDLYCQEIQ
jgi:hypothetical protein